MNEVITPVLNNIFTDIQRIFDEQRANQFIISTAKERKAKIKKLHNAIIKYREAFHEAMYADFKKPAIETDLFDLFPVTSEAKHTGNHVEQWMRPKKVKTPTALLGTNSQVKYEPKGVVLIISPWNVPINLTFGPLVSALAAGNRVMIKPSEMTPNTSRLMSQVIKEIFEEEEVAIFEGGIDVATALLKLPFNHIFFTGSPNIGKIVMRAAAENLASVTLELGGKCPTIIDETANLNEAASRVVWAKYSNSGQTCIAPDYLLVHEKQKNRLLNLLELKIKELYGSTENDRQTGDSLGRIVNHKHFLRIKYLFDDAISKGAKIVCGGHFDEADNYIEPTVLTNITDEMELMHEEIFGPLLPVCTYSKTERAIQVINSKPEPLALYIFSKQSKNTTLIVENTRAGGTCINDCTIHYSNPNLPFGGTNNSGIGKAHGIYGFEAFSNQRALLKQNSPYGTSQLLAPPYNDRIQKLVDLTLKWL